MTPQTTHMKPKSVIPKTGSKQTVHEVIELAIVTITAVRPNNRNKRDRLYSVIKTYLEMLYGFAKYHNL